MFLVNKELIENENGKYSIEFIIDDINNIIIKMLINIDDIVHDKDNY